MRRNQTTDERQKRTARDEVHTSQSSKRQTEPVVRNIQAIVDLERKALDERKNFSRLSDLATRFAGSPAFIAGHVALFGVWIVLNTTRLAFDRIPFNLLSLALTFETIILTGMVLVVQRDLKRLHDLRGHLDLQVNILAEQELTAMIGILNRICDRLGIDTTSAEPEVEQLAKETDVQAIATATEKNLDE